MNTDFAFSPREVVETECDRFNFETPGKIQSHGAMLVLQEPSLVILQLSQNTDKIMGINHREMVNQPITDFLDPKAITTFTKALKSSDLSMVNPLSLSFRGTTCDVILLRSEEFLILEVEPVRSDVDNNDAYQMAAMQAMEKFQNAMFVEQLVEIATNEIREVTDFDRVMYYRFDEDYNGQVMAESTVRGVDSFLHLHFPASDIPLRVRQLYMNTKSRYLPDLNEPQVSLVPETNPVTKKPLDMSLTILRAVAPTHIEYMKNLGINSSLSFTILRNGRMIGMFACHHYSGKNVAYINRLVCEQIVEMFVAMLDQIDNDDVHAKRLSTIKNRVQVNLLNNNGIDSESDILNMVNADGAAVYRNGELTLLGFTPDENDVRGLVQVLSDQSYNVLYQEDATGLLVTSRLSTVLDGAERIKHAASGIMAIPISKQNDDFIIWFRPERIISATWAGNPDQAVDIDEKTMRVSPRKSFNAWKKNVQNTCETWKTYEVQMVVELRDALMAKS